MTDELLGFQDTHAFIDLRPDTSIAEIVEAHRLAHGNPLRDGLAHSYADELPPERPVREPIVTDWREAVKILGLAAFLLVMFALIIYPLAVLAAAQAVRP